jgi:methionyl-tRNA formyltransferase
MIDKKIIFLGTPSISAYLLEGMIKAGFNIVGVITQEDKPQGRNMKLAESPVSFVANKYRLKLFKPHRLNKEHEFLSELDPDLLLTFAYGQIISEKVLGFSKLPPLNFHASLLPKYRGAAPIQYALKNGEKESGISLMEMIKAMDAGRVFAQDKIQIEASDNYSSMCVKMQELALEMANKYLPLYFENKLVGEEQDESEITFCPSIKKDEEHLDLHLEPADFTNLVRSLADVPGGFVYFKDSILKIFETKVYDETTDYPIGQVIIAKKKLIVVQVEGGTVSVIRIQKPGKKIMSASDFNNGVHDFEGEILK